MNEFRFDWSFGSGRSPDEHKLKGCRDSGVSEKHFSAAWRGLVEGLASFKTLFKDFAQEKPEPFRGALADNVELCVYLQINPTKERSSGESSVPNRRSSFAPNGTIRVTLTDKPDPNEIRLMLKHEVAHHCFFRLTDDKRWVAKDGPAICEWLVRMVERHGESPTPPRIQASGINARAFPNPHLGITEFNSPHTDPANIIGDFDGEFLMNLGQLAKEASLSQEILLEQALGLWCWGVYAEQLQGASIYPEELGTLLDYFEDCRDSDPIILFSPRIQRVASFVDEPDPRTRLVKVGVVGQSMAVADNRAFDGSRWWGPWLQNFYLTRIRTNAPQLYLTRPSPETEPGPPPRTVFETLLDGVRGNPPEDLKQWGAGVETALARILRDTTDEPTEARALLMRFYAEFFDSCCSEGELFSDFAQPRTYTLVADGPSSFDAFSKARRALVDRLKELDNWLPPTEDGGKHWKSVEGLGPRKGTILVSGEKIEADTLKRARELAFGFPVYGALFLDPNPCMNEYRKVYAQVAVDGHPVDPRYREDFWSQENPDYTGPFYERIHAQLHDARLGPLAHLLAASCFGFNVVSSGRAVGRTYRPSSGAPSGVTKRVFG